MSRRVKGPDGVVHIFPDDATDQEISAALEAPPATARGNQTERTWMDTARDVGAGFAKAAGRTVKLAVDDVPHAFGGAGLSDYIDMATGRPEGDSYQRVSEGLKATNTPQRVGGAVETAAEMAIPLTKAAEAVPTVAKAGAKFQDVMSAAKNLTVDVTEPGKVALRINELAERGGSMPMAVRKFLNRATDPNKAALTYEEARDFASNISRLSANEYQRLTPVVAREVANLRVTLNESIAQTAKAAGKLDVYRAAMKEYAQAMRIRNAIEAVAEGAKKSAPYATAAGAGYWLTSKLRRMLTGEGE